MAQIKTLFGSIYPVSNKIFDVFWGDGWDNCVRVMRNKKNKLDVLKYYKKPPQHLLEQVTEIICNNKK
mgnify:CR=1 FL=1